MINNLIKKTLDSINIESFYMKTTKKTDKYCIFSINSEKEDDKTENDNLSEIYFITVNYWYKNPCDFSFYKKIISSLKKVGFILHNVQDIDDGLYFGKSIDFFYNNTKEAIYETKR